MSNKKSNSDDSRRDAFLDELLDDSEQEWFLNQLDNREEILAEKHLQEKIDRSLRQTYQFPRLGTTQIRQLASDIESARVKSSNNRDRLKFARLAIAATLLLIAGFSFWQFGSRSQREPSFEPVPLAQIYTEIVSREFRPYYECHDRQRFAEVFARRQGTPLGLKELPDDRRMLGISYLGGLSRSTTAMLCIVDGNNVIVFVDELEFDQPGVALSNGDPDLNVFRTIQKGLVFYEVSPLPEPAMTGYFEFLK